MVEVRRADLLIIGAGPAGFTALLWALDLGVKPLVLEAGGEVGGQLLATYNRITNYAGVMADNGRDLLRCFKANLDQLDNYVRTNSGVESIDTRRMQVVLAGGESVRSQAMLIATGVRRRRLAVAGEDAYIGRGILESGVRDKESVTGARVAIVGGGDAALENALVLSAFAREVTVIHRRRELRARPDFIAQAKSRNNINFLFDTEIAAIKGDETVRALDLLNNRTGEKRDLEVGFVLIRIGVQPNSEFGRGQIDLDEAGYIIVDRYCRTSAENIFAAGDVANPLSPTISTAAGMAATALKAIFRL